MLGTLLSNKLDCLTIEAPLQEETVDNLHLPSSVVQSKTTKNKLYVDIDNKEYMKAIEPYISKGNAEPLKAQVKFDYVSDTFTKKFVTNNKSNTLLDFELSSDAVKAIKEWHVNILMKKFHANHHLNSIHTTWITKDSLNRLVRKCRYQNY